MATLNLTVGGTTGLPYKDRAQCFVIRNTVDYSENNAAASDVVQVLNVPANTFVLRAGYRVITPEGAAAGGTLGDGADPDGFFATSDLNAAAGTTALSAGATVGYALGKFYTAADTIDHVVSAALDTAVVEYMAICIPL